MIFTLIILRQRWEPNKYYHPKSEWSKETMTMKGYYTLLRAPELEPHYLKRFSVIRRPSFFFFLEEALTPLQEI